MSNTSTTVLEEVVDLNLKRHLAKNQTTIEIARSGVIEANPSISTA